MLRFLHFPRKAASRSRVFSSSSSKNFVQSPPFGTPIAPFHLAFPVHDLAAARSFYGSVLGLEEGRSSDKWIDYNFFGHQIVTHLVGPTFRAQDFYNPVDADDVPVPHFGVALSVDNFHALAARLKEKQVKFIVEPHLRFVGKPGEQWTMFFKDPSNNNLEFKAMTNPVNLFARYKVEDPVR